MTWDPTDKHGWKRALETPSSPSAPARLMKKPRFDGTTDIKDVNFIEQDVVLDRNVNATQANTAKDAAATRKLLSTERGATESFFRPKQQRPLFKPIHGLTQGDINNMQPSDQRSAAHSHDNPEIYDILHTQCSQVHFGFHEDSTSHNVSTSAHSTHLDPYTNIDRISSNGVEDVTGEATIYASSSSQTNIFTSTTSTPCLTQLKGTSIVSTSAIPDPFSSQTSTVSSDCQGFVFGNGGNDLGRGYNSDYFAKIKNNPYTTALLPRARPSGIPVLRKAAEARDLFKQGRYGQAERDTVPQHTIEELQRVLQSLRKRFAKLKAMCDTAGIDATGDVWDRTTAIVEGDRPDIKQALDEDSGKGLKEYMAQVERWDKAVGHQAILMKRLNYKQQISLLERKVKETKAMATVDVKDGERQDNEDEARNENGEEWKGHKTRLGRRFSGLIEKN